MNVRKLGTLWAGIVTFTVRLRKGYIRVIMTWDFMGDKK